jgi:hypothetical protein
MEGIIAMFKKLIAWLNEFIATAKEFAAGFEKNYGFETAE